MNNTFYKEDNLSGLKRADFQKQSTEKKLIYLFYLTITELKWL